MKKEFIKKAWKNPRWHSLIVLIIWIVVLTILMGITTLIQKFSSPNTLNSSEVSKNSYDEKFQRLIKADYAFTYEINLNNEIIKYDGIKYENVINGYRERKDGIIKYIIQDGISYSILLNEKNIITNLYENINSNLLDLNYLYNLTKNIEEDEYDYTENITTNTHEYNLFLDNENIKITIIENKKNIENIIILKDQTKYDLKYIIS